MRRSMLSLESIHGIMFIGFEHGRPMDAEARAALNSDDPVAYAKDVLKVTKAPDSTTGAVMRYLKDVAES